MIIILIQVMEDVENLTVISVECFCNVIPACFKCLKIITLLHFRFGNISKVSFPALYMDFLSDRKCALCGFLPGEPSLSSPTGDLLENVTTAEEKPPGNTLDKASSKTRQYR